MGDADTVKVVLRKKILVPGLKNIDLKSLREAVAKAQSNQKAPQSEKVGLKKPSKEPVVMCQFNSPEKIVIKQEPGSPMRQKRCLGQRVVSIKPGTWTQPNPPAVKRVSFGPDKVTSLGKQPQTVKTENPEYSCSFCDFASFDAVKYRVHISSHIETRNHHCTECTFSTHHLAAYNRHMRTHKKAPEPSQTPSSEYKCSLCNFKSSTQQGLAKHKASMNHHKLKGPDHYKCLICDYTDSDLLKVTQHVSTHQKNQIWCPKCSDLDVATEHTPECPVGTGSSPYNGEDVIVRPKKRKLSCTLCKFESDEILFLMEHIKAHSRNRSEGDGDQEEELPFCCTICDYRCSRPAKLVEHMRNHGPGTVFCCKICKFESKEISTFRVHWKSHSAKPRCFQCFVCLKNFPTAVSLSEHMIVHVKGKAFACNICEYQCLTKQQLLLHLRIHSKAKPQVLFPCPLCKSKYPTSSSLKQHLRNHSSQDKPFQCGACDYSCYTEALLRQHLEKHRTEGKFRCKICQATFVSETKLKFHVREHVASMTPVSCSVCHAGFSSRALLKRHWAANPSCQSFTCENCQVVFLDENEYNSHLVDHEIADSEAANSERGDTQTINATEILGNADYVEEQVYSESGVNVVVDESQRHILDYPMVTE